MVSTEPASQLSKGLVRVLEDFNDVNEVIHFWLDCFHQSSDLAVTFACSIFLKDDPPSENTLSSEALVQTIDKCQFQDKLDLFFKGIFRSRNYFLFSKTEGNDIIRKISIKCLSNCVPERTAAFIAGIPILVNYCEYQMSLLPECQSLLQLLEKDEDGHLLLKIFRTMLRDPYVNNRLFAVKTMDILYKHFNTTFLEKKFLYYLTRCLNDVPAIKKNTLELLIDILQEVHFPLIQEFIILNKKLLIRLLLNDNEVIGHKICHLLKISLVKKSDNLVLFSLEEESIIFSAFYKTGMNYPLLVEVLFFGVNHQFGIIRRLHMLYSKTEYKNPEIIINHLYIFISDNVKWEEWLDILNDYSETKMDYNIMILFYTYIKQLFGTPFMDEEEECLKSSFTASFQQWVASAIERYESFSTEIKYIIIEILSYLEINELLDERKSEFAIFLSRLLCSDLNIKLWYKIIETNRKYGNDSQIDACFHELKTDVMSYLYTDDSQDLPKGYLRFLKLLKNSFKVPDSFFEEFLSSYSSVHVYRLKNYLSIIFCYLIGKKTILTRKFSNILERYRNEVRTSMQMYMDFFEKRGLDDAEVLYEFIELINTFTSNGQGNVYDKHTIIPFIHPYLQGCIHLLNEGCVKSGLCCIALDNLNEVFTLELIHINFLRYFFIDLKYKELNRKHVSRIFKMFLSLLKLYGHCVMDEYFSALLIYGEKYRQQESSNMLPKIILQRTMILLKNISEVLETTLILYMAKSTLELIERGHNFFIETYEFLETFLFAEPEEQGTSPVVGELRESSEHHQ